MKRQLIQRYVLVEVQLFINCAMSRVTVKISNLRKLLENRILITR